MRILSKKILLLTMVTCTAFSACNINCGFFSWFFGQSSSQQLIAQQRIAQQRIAQPLVKSAVKATVSVAPVISFGLQLSKNLAPNNLAPKNFATNNFVQKSFVPKLSLNKSGASFFDNMLDVLFIVSVVALSAFLIKKYWFPGKKAPEDTKDKKTQKTLVENPSKTTKKYEEINDREEQIVIVEKKREDLPKNNNENIKKETLSETPGGTDYSSKQEYDKKCNDASSKVEALVDFVNEKNLFMDYTSFSVDDIKNDVYQFRVDEQDTNSCGPRALFYAKMMSDFFDKALCNGGAVDIKILQDCLLPNSELAENAKLREFFNNIFDKKIVPKNSIDGDNYFVHDDLIQEKDAIGDILFLDKDKTKCNMLPNPMAGKCEPINFKSDHLEHAAQVFGIKETTVIDGYETIAKKDLGDPFNLVGIMESCLGNENKVVNRKAGYYHSFIITEGANERGTNSKDSIGHWFCLFGIKIAEKEYAWFVIDSLNSNFLEDNTSEIKITAYINKFLSFENKYKDYDILIEENIKIAEQEKLEKQKKERDRFYEFKKFLESNSDPKKKTITLGEIVASAIRTKYKIIEKEEIKKEILTRWLLDENANMLRLKHVSKEDKEELGVKVAHTLDRLGK